MFRSATFVNSSASRSRAVHERISEPVIPGRVVTVLLSVLVVVLVAGVQERSRHLAAIIATMPLTAPLAMWIVLSASRGDQAPDRRLCRAHGHRVCRQRADVAVPLIFSYGTLQQDDVQLATFGRLLHGQGTSSSGASRPG